MSLPHHLQEQQEQQQQQQLLRLQEQEQEQQRLYHQSLMQNIPNKSNINNQKFNLINNCKQQVEIPSGRTVLEFDGNDQVLCRVCGDKASGFHYGVHSCEGCKGFFRRSIQQKIQYRPCTKNQQCNILRINRNRCQYCRLKKCIAAGMSRDAVRFGRVPKREKAKIMAAMQTSRMKTQESRVLGEMNDEGKIIETIVRAHYDTCDYTRNKMEPFITKAKAKATYAMCTGTTCPMKGRPEESFLEQFSERFMDHVRQVCTFAKLVPGFKCLHHDDQVTLLKSCVFEVLLVRLSGLFENQGLICLNGDIIRKETIDQMPQGNARFLMDSVFELAQRLNQFRLSDAEIGLFCAVVIITADRPGLRNAELVKKMQNKLKLVLSNILLPQHPEHSSIFTELMTMIHDLRTLNTVHTEKFLQQCKVSTPPVSLQQHILYASTAAAANGWRRTGAAHHDREGSTGNVSPHSSDTSTEDQNCRRSPLGSVSSSESISSSEVSKLTGHDLKVNGSVLMNALTTSAPVMVTANGCPFGNNMAAATVTITRKRSLAEDTHTSSTTTENNKAATISTVTKFKVRKVDSPIDSGIDSPKAGQSNSTNTSVCSSPRSSMEEDKKEVEPSEPRQAPVQGKAAEEQHPLLKRALQQPPQPYNNMGVATFQDEVYKPHKKFRRMALSIGDDCPSSSTGYSSSASPPAPPHAHSNGVNNSQTSLLVTQLSQPPLHQAVSSAASTAASGGSNSLLASTLSRVNPMGQEHTKRNEIIANLILNNPCTSSNSPSYNGVSHSGLLMCARSSAPSPGANSTKQTTTLSPGFVASAATTTTTNTNLGRHIPVQAAPTKPSSGSVASKVKESKMSQLAAAAVATLASDIPQPLNLSTRTPPPSQHDVPTEA